MNGSPSPLQRADHFFALLTARLPPPLNDARVRMRLQSGTALALAMGLFVYLLLFSQLLAPLNRLATDFLYHPVAVQPNIAIIEIDQQSIDELGDLPWARSVHAALLKQLEPAAPRLIVFDVLFAQPSADDTSFSNALKQSGNVIVATAGVADAAHLSQPGTFPSFDQLILPDEGILGSARGIGHQVVLPDDDGIVRRIPIAIEENGTRYPALGLAAAQQILGASKVEYDLRAHTAQVGPVQIPLDERGNTLLNFSSPTNGIPSYSYIDVLHGDVPAATFANKIVFIGDTSTAQAEDLPIPLELGEEHTHNVNLEADLTNMLISEPPQTLQMQDALGQLGLTLILALLAGLTLPHIRPLIAAALTLVYLLLLLLFSFEAFNRGLIIPMLYPALALLLTAGSIITFRYLFEERRRQFLTSLFRRYVPADSVGRVVDAIDRGELRLTGTRRMVTVLYADLRGFGTLSDEMLPTDVLVMVNHYMELALHAIQAEGGTISKPMGDALIAIWNAPLDQPDHAARALRTAIQIRSNIARYQQDREQNEKLNFGIGLATGWAVLGNMNALGKVEYTLVGDTVNVASRISAFANNNQILADTDTAHNAPPEIIVRELSPVRVRGRKEPLPVWEIRGQEPIEEEEEEEEDDE